MKSVYENGLADRVLDDGDARRHRHRRPARERRGGAPGEMRRDVEDGVARAALRVPAPEVHVGGEDRGGAAGAGEVHGGEYRSVPPASAPHLEEHEAARRRRDHGSATICPSPTSEIRSPSPLPAARCTSALTGSR